MRLLGGDPWRDAATLHRRLAYVPGEVSLWPNLTGGEVIDLLGRLRGGHDPRRRADLLERFDLDPTQEGPRPTPRATGRRSPWSRRWPPDVELLLLDEPTSGLDPLMEAVFQDCIREEAARRPHGAAVQPHPGRGRGALRPGQHHPGRPDRAARHARRAAAPDPHDGRRRDPAAAPTAWTPYPGWRTSTGSTAGSASTSTPTTSTRRCSYLASLGIRSLVSHPPTLEELFLRQYGDRRERARRDRGSTGTVALLRLALRRDRVRLPVWVLAMTALTYFSGQRDGHHVPHAGLDRRLRRGRWPPRPR